MFLSIVYGHINSRSIASILVVNGDREFVDGNSRDVQPKNGIIRRTSPIFRPVAFLVAFGVILVAFGVVLVAFGVVLVAFGVVLVAPRTGWCVTVAYESRARWRSPFQHNHNDVLVSSSLRADDLTRDRRREGLGLYSPAAKGGNPNISDIVFLSLDYSYLGCI